MTTTLKVATISDRELVLTRIINAPREKIFKAWTDTNCSSNGSLPRPIRFP